MIGRHYDVEAMTEREIAVELLRLAAVQQEAGSDRSAAICLRAAADIESLRHHLLWHLERNGRQTG